MGFHSPPKCRGLGVRIQLRPPLPLPTCAPSRAREEVQGRVRVGAGDKKAAVVPRKSERSGPKGGTNARGRGAVQRGNRKEDAGVKVPRDRGPFLALHPGAKAGAEGSRESEKAAELTPRSSSERKSGPSSRPSCGVARPGAPGEKMGLGRHKGKH